MKSFNLFLQDLNDGQTHAGLTGDLGELLQAVQAHGRAGSMTLKIKIAPASRGGGDVDKITITAERKLELPKPEQPQDFFWLTDTAEPTRQHPRQHALDLRDAQDPRGGLRTPAQALAETFTTPDADGVITFKEAKQ
jgi:hypothetical protein